MEGDVFWSRSLIHPDLKPWGSSEHALTMALRWENGVRDSTFVNLSVLELEVDGLVEGSLKSTFLKYSLMRDASFGMLMGLRAGRQARGQMPSWSILSISVLKMMVLWRSLWLSTTRPLTKGMRSIGIL